MKTHTRLLVAFAAAVLAAPTLAQDSVTAQDLSGWWSADPVHDGETSHLALQFIDKDGKQEAHLSLPDIGAYDINLGEVAIDGDKVNTRGLAFPLAFNAGNKTLTGTVPADAAPIYNIPVEFRRGAPLVKPAPNLWKAPRPKVRWTVDTGSPVWAGVELSEDRATLYVGNENGTLSAITRDGTLRWKFETGKPIRAQPYARDGYVFVHSDSGFVYRLDARTGKEDWRARVDSGSEPRLPVNEKGTRWDRYASSVVYDGGQLYVASRDKNLYALNSEGHEVWRVAASDIMTATPVIHGDLVIFADYAGKVTAVSRTDGKPRWTFDARLAVAGDLALSRNRLLLGSRSYDLIALDADTGKEEWRRYYWFSWIESPPVVMGKIVYTGSSDAVNVYARNRSDGSLRWKTAVPGYAWSRPAVGEELLVVGTVGDRAFPGARAGSLVAMDRATGEIRWIYLDPPSEETVKAHKNWGFGASPVEAAGVVYAADLEGRVHAIELE